MDLYVLLLKRTESSNSIFTHAFAYNPSGNEIVSYTLKK